MKNILIAFILMLSFVFKAQQDPQYNLYQFNQMVINPAYAGARDVLSVVASVRKQWSGFTGAPQTSCISAHSPILNNKLGVGLTIVNDAMGPRNMLGIYGNVAYILKLSNKFKLSFGLNGGYNRFQFDFNKLTFKTTETSTFINQNQSYNKLDLNAGTYLRSNTFFIGISATHLGASDVYHLSDPSGNGSLSYRLRTHLFFTIGNSFRLNNNLIFAPTIMLRGNSGHGNMDLNLNFFIYKKLWLGVFYRGGYGPGFLMQYYITDKFKVAYSYDTGITDAKALGGSHEVMIGFDFAGNKNKSKVVSPRFL